MDELGNHIIDKSLEYWIPQYEQGHFSIDQRVLVETDIDLKEFESLLIERAKAYGVDIQVAYDAEHFKFVIDWKPAK